MHFNGPIAFVQAAEDIPAGSEICINYVQTEMPTSSRRAVCCVRESLCGEDGLITSCPARPVTEASGGLRVPVHVREMHHRGSGKVRESTRSMRWPSPMQFKPLPPWLRRYTYARSQNNRDKKNVHRNQKRREARGARTPLREGAADDGAAL